MATIQSKSHIGINAFNDDSILKIASSSFSPIVKSELEVLGNWAAANEVKELARLATYHKPIHRSFDMDGKRIDHIELHPSYHALMRKSISMGLHASIWNNEENEKGQNHQVRAVRLFIMSGIELGHLASISSTNASVAALASSPLIAKEWMPIISTKSYESSAKAPGQKLGVTLGYAIGEFKKSININDIESISESNSDGTWNIKGTKSFVATPMGDAFIVVAKTNSGPSCFLVPHYLADGKSNQIEIQRLKENLGGQSTAHAELVFNGSVAQLIGEEGQAEKVLAPVHTHLNLDQLIIASGAMRALLAEVLDHLRHHKDKPLMQRVFADMALDVAAISASAFRVCQAFDRTSTNPEEQNYALLMSLVFKYWSSKIMPNLISEALECFGVNGLNFESNFVRVLRDVPSFGLFPKPSNLVALEALKLVSQNPKILTSILAGVQRDLGGEAAQKTVDVIQKASEMAVDDPGAARIFTEQLALTAAAAELKRIGMDEVASAFIETRLGGLWRSSYGMLDARQNADRLIEALYPNK